MEEILFEALLKGRKAAVSSGLKGGYFLENGGLVHLEVFLRSQSDTPILEASTPECRSPHELLLFQRAFDHMLARASADSRVALGRHGCQGRIAFGKNNSDVRGVGYGCHENYLVYDKMSPWGWFNFGLGLPILCVLLVPVFFLLILMPLMFLLGRLLARPFPELTGRLIHLWQEKFPNSEKTFRVLYLALMNTLLFAPVTLYSLMLRWSVFRPFLRDLTPFLVTRQILAGAGGLDFKKGCFEISQRPRLTSSLGEIVLFGKRKTIFDLKGLLYDPVSVFRSRRKLTITLGDSNLSDTSFLLKVGTASLIIEMIEGGVRFPDLRLRRPVGAFREISRGGPWKEVNVRGPGTSETPGRLTAIAIQREYLRLARKFYAGRPEGRARHQEILALWEETLNQIAETPGQLSDRLDWAAKKLLLDRAVFAVGTWREFFAWGSIFSRASTDALARSDSLEELLSRCGVFSRLRLRRVIRRALRRDHLDPRRYLQARDLYYQARKIDLRYHEIGSNPGYERQLESNGLLNCLTTREEVERATREPPAGTRAQVRGYYVALGEDPDALRVNWNEIEFTGSSRTIDTSDPFNHSLPTDNTPPNREET